MYNLHYLTTCSYEFLHSKEVFDILGREPLIEVAEALEAAALSEPYFIKRKLYPNVDFYSGLIYKAMGFPTEYMPVLFAIPRFAGWLAHWNEFIQDPDNKIVRPRQLYLGERERNYIQMSARVPNSEDVPTALYSTSIKDDKGEVIDRMII